MSGRCFVCKHGNHVTGIPKADWPGMKNKQLTATRVRIRDRVKVVTCRSRLAAAGIYTDSFQTRSGMKIKFEIQTGMDVI